MKKFALLFLIAGFISCQKERIVGTGTVVTESRTLSDFDKVFVSGSTNVFITQGNTFDIKVQAYSNLLQYLETKVENGTLIIAYKSNSNVTNDNSQVYITMPVLTGLSTSGSGNIKTTGSFPQTNNFAASISGSGNIDIGDAQADNYTIQISGSGNIKSFGLVTQKGDISIEGSGDAEVNAVQNLNASIKGSGDIYYKGNPAIVSQISGSGKLIKQ